MERSKITYIHPVHAVFQFADLTRESVSMRRFIELLEGIEVEDRYVIVNCIAPLVGLNPRKQQYELDLQLKRCRQFKEACLQIDADESHAIRTFVEHVFDWLFLSVWKRSVREISENEEAGKNERLSCRTEDFQRNNLELMRSNGCDSSSRIESFRRYNLFGEQVAGPLIGYC